MLKEAEAIYKFVPESYGFRLMTIIRLMANQIQSDAIRIHELEEAIIEDKKIFDEIEKVSERILDNFNKAKGLI